MDVWLHQGFEAWAAHFCFLVADVPLEGFVGGGAAAVGDGPRVREGQGHPENGVRGRRESRRRAGRDGQTSESKLLLSNRSFRVRILTLHGLGKRLMSCNVEIVSNSIGPPPKPVWTLPFFRLKHVFFEGK